MKINDIELFVIRDKYDGHLVMSGPSSGGRYTFRSIAAAKKSFPNWKEPHYEIVKVALVSVEVIVK